MTINNGIKLKSKVGVVGLTLAATGLLAADFATPANAAAYTVAVYAPNNVGGSQIQGWANLSRDCSGTFGCYNFVKIERQRWYGVNYVAGNWANYSGWNNQTAYIGGTGCYNYRTTVDSYSDVAGGYGSGVNVGQVGATGNGTKIYRYRNTWSSGWATRCA